MVALELSLRFAALLTLLGAVLGAYGMIAPRALAGLSGLETGPEGAPYPALRATFGGTLLMHAATFTALVEAPRIGSCLAAAVGAAWLGRSAGRAVSALLSRRTTRRQVVLLLAEAAAGVCLWAPLWNYIDLIRRGFAV
jgi:hypothetical protein